MDRLSAVGDPGLRAALLYVRAEDHGVTADELAAHDGIHRNVARDRLERLAAAGLVYVKFRRRTDRSSAGRPAKTYSAAPETMGIEFPARHYERLVGLLAGDRSDARLREIGADFGRELALATGLRKAHTVETGFERMCAAVRSLGYQATLERVDEDEAVIATPTCPLRPLVVAQPADGAHRPGHVGRPGRGRRCGHPCRRRHVQGAPLPRSPCILSCPSEAREVTMVSYRYLVVGGGMTGDAVCRGIRDVDENGTIGLVGEEPVPPYKRPPLTKGLWKGGDPDKIWRGTEERGVELHLGRRIVSIDPAAGRATDDAGEEYAYERLILATGAAPRRLPDGGDDVIYFRTLDDYRRARALSDEGARFLVVGGGFIGSEIAAALRDQGRDVTIVFPEAGIGWRTFPADLAHAVTDYYREKGVDVRTETVFESAEGFDAVVAGLGVVPRTELAEAAGLPVDDGIVVDEYGRVPGFENVFAAGDVARFPIPALGRSGRSSTRTMRTRTAGSSARTRPGATTRYEHLPFFYSDLFDLGYEAVGEVDSRNPVLQVWLEPYRKGVVAFTDAENRPRGFLLWNVWGKVDAARALIRAAQPIGEDALRGLAG